MEYSKLTRGRVINLLNTSIKSADFDIKTSFVRNVMHEIQWIGYKAVRLHILVHESLPLPSV